MESPAISTRTASLIRISVVMPTISFVEPFERCARRALETIRRGDGDEFIVVVDGPLPPLPSWLAKASVTVLATGQRSGPAAARNLAAASAVGDVLLFVDADVELALDATDRVRVAFASDPTLCGLFGAYDAEPAAPGLVSRFRNLLHHHTHTLHAGPADTFWAGCGGVRAATFADLGGFDPRYRQPSIEDIEFGRRVAAAGKSVRLDPTITGTHHKRWTLGSMIATDVVRRAIPWTRLLLATDSMSNRLSLDWRSRVSGGCAIAAVAAAAAAFIRPWSLLLVVAALATIALLNRSFYALCRAHGGPMFAAGCFVLHWLYFTYATLTFAAVVLLHRTRLLAGRP
jgi:GT2 family glycosyltransferase